jgi:hypothetical protein
VPEFTPDPFDVTETVTPDASVWESMVCPAVRAGPFAAEADNPTDSDPAPNAAAADPTAIACAPDAVATGPTAMDCAPEAVAAGPTAVAPGPLATESEPAASVPWPATFFPSVALAWLPIAVLRLPGVLAL